MGGWCETCSTVRTNSPLSHSPRNCSPRNGFKGFFSEPVSFSRRVNWPLSVARNQRVTRNCRSSGVVPSAMAAKRSFGSPQYAAGRGIGQLGVRFSAFHAGIRRSQGNSEREVGDRICGLNVHREPDVSMVALAFRLTKGGAVKPDKSPEKLASDLRKLVQPAKESKARVGSSVILSLPMIEPCLLCAGRAFGQGIPTPPSCLCVPPLRWRRAETTGLGETARVGRAVSRTANARISRVPRLALPTADPASQRSLARQQSAAKWSDSFDAGCVRRNRPDASHLKRRAQGE